VTALHRWDVSTAEAREIQRELRARLVLRAPRGFEPRRVAGADLSLDAGRGRGVAAVVVVDTETLETVEQVTAEADVAFPYVPGLLSFRELPPVLAAWAKLRARPDAIVFDGHGLAHPRRFGLACHGGVLLGVPSIGCAKSILIGRHGVLGEKRGATADLVVGDGEVVGAAVRTRAGVSPVYVSPGHMMDTSTAVRVVLALCPRYREPETTRRAHKLVLAGFRALAGRTAR
jgi:deoxyribonuclease V